jgi:hypothetical protein
MAYNYVTYPLKDLGAGIDQQSAENQIGEGYCELILNADPKPMGYIAKRLGYQRHAGQLPVRVTKVEYSTTGPDNLCFFLDSEIDISSINLLTTRRTPLVVQGRTSDANTTDSGDFISGSDSVEWYATFNSDVEQSFATGNNVLQNDGIGNEYVFVHTSRKTAFSVNSNEVFLTDETRLDTLTGNVEVTYDNNTGSAFDGFIYLSPKPEVTGTTYITDEVTPISIATGTNTTTITTATHGLSNFNIDTRVYRVDGSDWIEVTPDEVSIAANGDVSFEITNSTPSAFDAVFILTAYPAENAVFGQIADGATDSITFNTVNQDFVGVVCYLEETPGGVKREVIPESIEVDAATKQCTVTFTNNTGANTKFFIYWEEIEITSNKLCVTSYTQGGTAFTDTNPQLTIWGLDHETIYGQGSVDQRPGWVTHIDSYKSEGINRLVAGLGGNLFTESTSRVRYNLPTLYPDIAGRVATDVYVGPIFYTTGEQSLLAPGVQRTQGWIEGDSIVNNYAPVSTIEWQSGNVVRYFIDNVTYTTSIISNILGVGTIKVNSAAFSKHNGEFDIVSASISGTGIEILATNPAIACADFDETNSPAMLGAFNNTVTLLNQSRFQEGDVVGSDLFDFDSGYTVNSSATTSLYLNNITEYQTIPAGLRLVGRRTTNVIPLRDIDGLGTVEGLVRFDSLTQTGLDRKLTAVYVNAFNNTTVSIVDNGTNAIVTLPDPLVLSTLSFSVGQTIVLREAGVWTGSHVITGLLSEDELSVSGITTGSTSGTLVGNSVEVDETLSIEDSISNSVLYSVQSRWAPIEAPTDSYDLTKQTYIQHLDSNEYSNQSYLRSTMVANNLYTTNGDDEVMKYDGLNIYRAGLPRWQPQLFITSTQSPASGGLVDFDAAEVTLTNTPDGTRAEVADGEESKLKVGMKVRDNLGNDYIIESVTTGKDIATGTDDVGIIQLNSTIPASVTTLTEVSFVKYYFRLNAVDSNRNLIASAITGSEDTTIEIAGPTQIRIRLTGFPAWHIYDYNTIEVEIYRTVVGLEAPYYKLITKQIPFNQNDGYIDFIDSYSDESLRDLDVVNNALLPFVGGQVIQRLGTQWDEPMRARYVTSAGNRLVLANLKDYPQLDIQYESDGVKFSDLLADTNPVYQFKKDNTDVATLSDLENRQSYEFVSDSGAVSITPATDITNNSDVSFTIASATTPSAGDWVYLYHSAYVANENQFTDTDVNTGTDTLTITSHGYSLNDIVVLDSTDTLPGGISENTPYYVIPTDVNSIQLSTTPSGPAIDITTVGSVGGAFFIRLTTERSLQYAGWFKVASANSGVDFTINHVSTQAGYTPSAIDVDSFVTATTGTDVPVLLAEDGNYDQEFYNPDSAVNTDVEIALIRLANAINTSMRQASNPWMIAAAGGDYRSNQLIIRQPKVLDSTIEVTLPNYDETKYSIFANQIRRDAIEQVSASTRLYPSRLIFSGNNYPEIFDNPRAVIDAESLGAIDVNSADGEQITGIIPFFGESAFGAAQKDSIIVVFKESSIYLVNLAAKEQGQQAVQKIESQGLGCTAPYSIASTRDGINFANRSGIFKLTRDLRIEYIGRKVERLWESGVNLNQLDEVQGHHYSIGRQYKLSYPRAGASSNSEVFTYNHTREYSQSQEGSWTKYNNHPATGWANLLSDAYFSTSSGAVMKIRNTGDVSDYRDDDQAVAMEIRFRAIDFGDSGIRKAVANVLAHFRNLANQTGTEVFSAMDLSNTYSKLDDFRITGQQNQVVSIQFAVNRRKGVYFQFRITNSTLDEPVELAGFDIRVAGLDDKTILQAKSTNS